VQLIIIDVVASLVSLEGLPECRRRLAHEAKKELVGDDIGDCQEYECFYAILKF
jgi:hypothetical protein